MAVKRIMSCTEIADGSPFRSLTDVNRYLQQTKEELKDIDSLLRLYQAQFARIERQPLMAAESFKITREGKDGGDGGKIITDKIDSFKFPKMDELQKHFLVVDQLAEKSKELETIAATVSVQFKGVKGQPETLKGIKGMQTAVDAQYKKALTFLEQVGQKYAPTAFKELISGVKKKLGSSLSFKKSTTSVYAKTQDGGKLVFTVYIMLQGLEEDDGSIHDKYFLVFTCILSPLAADPKKLGVEYYVTVMQEFETPGHFHVGRRVGSETEALAEIGNLLSLENISNAIGTLPHGLTGLDKGWFREADYVADLEVDAGSITFWFLKKVNKNSAGDLAIRLRPQIQSMLRHIRNAHIKQRMLEDADGRQGVVFTLTNLAAGDQLNINDLNTLKNEFKLSDQQVNDIVKVVNKGGGKRN